MTKTLLVTPDNWFDLTRLAAERGEVRATLAFTVVDSSGRRPLDAVRLDELRAIHQTFGAWWPLLGSSSRLASVEAEAYDRFLVESRALLEEKAAAVLSRADGTRQSPSTLIAFPDLRHSLFADPTGAVAFLKPFFPLSHSPSVVDWARRRAIDERAVSDCRNRAWLRLVLQKVAVEDDLDEALACLRAVYAGSDTIRSALVSEEARLLQACNLFGPEEWTRSLGLDRATRVASWISAPASRTTRQSVQPDITIVIPSYCHEAFIESTIESALAQTYPRFRILVLDDSSADCTVARASSVQDPRLRVQVNTTTLGLGNSVLHALPSIDTPYVAFLNSDDIFHSERLERCRAVLESSPRVQVVATGVAPIDPDGRRLSIDNVSRLFDGRRVAAWIQWFSKAGHFDRCAHLLPQLLERNFLISSSNIVCRTEFLRARIDRLRGLEFCFDWQIFLDAAADERLACLPEELLGYRLHGSNTVWFDAPRRARYRIEVNRVLANTIRQLVPGGATSPGELFDALTHAAKHSEANGYLLSASELLNRATPEGRDGSWLQGWSQLEQLDETGSGPTATDTSAAAESERYEIATAARALAEVSSEKAGVARDAAQRTRSSPEWLVGDILWNRARLSRLGRPAARGLRRLQDGRNRLQLAIRGRASRTSPARPRAVVASCWSFPNQSHTFVYQEIQALEAAGFDYRVFCCDTTSRAELHAAFQDLWRKRIVLRSEPWLIERDRDYFLGARPDRVQALLEKLQAATGWSKDALLRDSIVTMAFTFARHVELSRANYLHTYFFYDQSFMALVAAYLLDLPRGVTAYADHMLNDYPLKCVPLHLELADIVVATSHRIKSELSAIGRGRFDEKILVKPNGIDTGQFPYVDAAQRLRQAGEPNLISVSRIEPKKGLVYLIEAVRLLRNRGVRVRLDIVGAVDPNTSTSAACFRQLTERIEQLGLSESIVLHGAKTREEFIPLLLRSRIFVAPYVETASGDKDGIPTSVLEAMSTGLPIVATDAGSITEAVTDGVEAVVVPQRDPERLAEAIERLLQDRTAYARMAEAARRRAVSQFDVHVTERPLHERIRACLRARPS